MKGLQRFHLLDFHQIFCDKASNKAILSNIAFARAPLFVRTKQSPGCSRIWLLYLSVAYNDYARPSHALCLCSTTLNHHRSLPVQESQKTVQYLCRSTNPTLLTRLPMRALAR